MTNETNDAGQYNVWIEGHPSKGYSEGREEITNICGGSSGSGSGFGGWDVSYHGKTESEAKDIAIKAATLAFIKSVRLYTDGNPGEYIKGTA